MNQSIKTVENGITFAVLKQFGFAKTMGLLKLLQ